MPSAIGEGGRAGAAGKFFTAVSEKYPEVPEGIFRDMQATMNAEYESMAAAQQGKVSRLQAYRERLRDPMLKPAIILGGFPTIDLDKHQKLILGGTARNARETGTLETVTPNAGG